MYLPKLQIISMFNESIRMKLILISFLSILFLGKSYSQVVVNNTNTVSWYVQNVLLGANVSVSNITLNGVSGNSQNEMVGEFSDVTSSVGLPNGIILATGDANLAASSNLSGSEALGGTGNSGVDVDLDGIASNGLYDLCILEFDFIPNGDTISFNYIFGSEEYPEYVCSEYNDVFGFFLTGNNPAGGTYNAQNIALIPDPVTPGLYTGTAVAINTVNSGSAGGFGTASNCSAIDPNWTSYNIFYTTNSGPNYEYDGRTTPLPVVVPVNCGETYHIKIAIADAGDAIYDSGVFLEAGSFSSNGSVVADPPNLGDIVMCSSVYTVDFQGPTVTPPYSIWDFGDGIGTSTAAAPTYTYADTGSYDVMYIAIDSSTCDIADTAYMTVTIIENEVLSGTFTIPPVDPCTDSLLISMAFTGTGADSIVWNMGNGDVFTDTLSFEYYYTIQGEYKVTMSAWDLDCGGTIVISDSVHFISDFSYALATAPDDTTLCSPPPYTMDFTSTGSQYSYWDFGDGSGNSTDANPTYIYSDSGLYNVTYIAIDSTTCNIADTVYFNVHLIQNEQLSADFQIPTFDPCSSPDSVLVQLAFTGSGADSLHWDMGNGTTFEDSLSIDYYYTNLGSYTITMEAYDFTCNNTESFSDIINFFIDSTEAIADAPEDTTLCSLPPFSIGFTSNGATPDHYWDFGDGGSSTFVNPTHIYNDSGLFEVMYVAIDSSTCNIADTVYFQVHLIQAEQFSAELNFTPPPPCNSDSMLVQLDFTGTGADSVVWDMGNGDIFSENGISYYYTIPGQYNVSMTAYDFTCNISETFTEEVTFVQSKVTEVVIPNVFTPNGDGDNDELKFVNIDGAQTYRLTIYNRWGRKVFQSEDPLEYWNGEIKGEGAKAKEGVYFFEIIYTDICSDKENVETGYVHLMR